MEILGIKSGEACKWWDKCLPHINSALDYGLGEYEAEDILIAIEEQRMQLWIVWDKGHIGTVVTQVHTYPNKKILLGLLLAGDRFKDWKHPLDETLTNFAKHEYCNYIEMFGRKGWKKMLEDTNFKEKIHIYTKEISHG